MGEDKTECAYCGAEISLETEGDTVPETRDDAAWERLAKQHYKNCEWVITRAYRDVE